MREKIFSQELNNCFLDERTQHLALMFHVFYHVDVTVCFVPGSNINLLMYEAVSRSVENCI